MLIWSRRFLTDYFHTAIILIIACYFSIKAFTIDEVGSIGKLYDLVQAAAQRHPVSGNHDGTYLTMTSKGVGRSHVATPATLTLALGDALWDPAHLLELWSAHMLIDTGVVTCPGIFPMAFTILWRRQSTAAAILSPVLGMATGIGVWLGTAKQFYGSVSVSATGQILPCVYGTVASAFSPILYSVVITLVRPQNYDWNDFKKEKLALERLESDLTTVHSHDKANRQDNRLEEGHRQSSAFDAQELKRWGRIAAFWSIATFLGHWFFSAWVVVAIIWLWVTMLVAIFYPIFDGGIQQITQVYRGLCVGNGRKEAVGDESSSSPSISDTAEEVKREDRT
ncbi:unnamed protein product [Aspergillus oryzae var. brunneus]|uniref:Unnamed protein product n=1 Tax=Aspergillus oryzae var. brunneus TaxID=332754 RepID=A0ABQ6L063_ASPOZ|nr:unnamed protein product [Aspergillus oryzae var. brunneus]